MSPLGERAAQAAYERWVRETRERGRLWNDATPVPWYRLSPAERDVWRAVVGAVCDTFAEG